MNAPADANDVAQLAAPSDRCAEHSVVAPELNVTVPVGVPAGEVTFADSCTAAPTNALDGAVTVVVVGCGGGGGRFTIRTRTVPEDPMNLELPG